MITGQQIREARSVLGWARWRLARQVYMSVKSIETSRCDVIGIRLAKIKKALEEARIRARPKKGTGFSHL